MTIIENKTPNLWYAVLKGIHECTAVGERGVARQYSVTAGRVENCQVGAFVAYASRFGQTLIDRRLYLPEAWANDTERRRGAAVPETVAFQTKPAIAAEMLVSLGATLVILTAGIDLSVGSVMALTAILTALLFRWFCQHSRQQV